MRILYTRPSFASLQKIYSSLPYFYASNFNVTFNSKFCDKRHTLRCSETNGLAPILRVYSKKKEKKRKEHTRTEYTCRPSIWNSSFPSYFASPPNRRTILLYVAGFRMKFSLLPVLVKTPETVKRRLRAKSTTVFTERSFLLRGTRISRARKTWSKSYP